ncbi:ATP-binding cassette domain-containing protein, partial [Photobacterium phosphoreum]|uniref:ATP-binding cassette domain-containing protein n=1 Tax=Photobacterium phosphoreum TaxID=659 RepID=UPI001E3F6367
MRVSGGNGVGTTSLLRMLCGLVRPEAGEVRWCGQSIWEERESFLSNMLYLGHEIALNERLTPLENLRFSSLTAGPKTSWAPCTQALQQPGLDEE